MIEEWRPVAGWEDSYEVSSIGRMKAKARKVLYIDGRNRAFPERLLSSKPNKKIGYHMISLYKDNTAHNRYVHRLVAGAFIPNPENKRDVNHLDGVRTNNNIANLQWTTHRENMQHAHAAGLVRILRGEDASNAKITLKAVQQLRSDIWNIVQDWAEENGVHTQTAWDAIAGRNWTNPVS